jgi:hypothetical protein
VAARPGPAVRGDARKFFEGRAESLIAWARGQFAAPTQEDAPVLDYLWRWFSLLHGYREVGFGMGPISHREILAWAQLYRIRPEPAEMAVLRDLDGAFLEHHARKGGAGESEVQSERPMTPELFDAVFK